MHATPVSLLDRLRSPADADAWVRFVRLYTPFLYHWARKHGLSAGDTDDLVQESVIQTLRHVDKFEPRHDGAFLAYLRTALGNKLKDEIRRARRAPHEPLGTDHADEGPSVFEEVIGRLNAQLREHSSAGPALRGDVTIVGLTELRDDRLVYRVSAPTLPGKRDEVRRAWRRLAFAAFREGELLAPPGTPTVAHIVSSEPASPSGPTNSD